MIEKLSKRVIPNVDKIKKPAGWQRAKDRKIYFTKGYKKRNYAERDITMFMFLV